MTFKRISAAVLRATSHNDAPERLPHQASHYAQAQVLEYNDMGQ